MPAQQVAAPTTTEPVPPAGRSLSVAHASKTFSAVRVLDDVSFALNPGEICALIGQNGSGKSTLIKVLAGFHEPDPGSELVIDGREVPLPLAPARTACCASRAARGPRGR